MDDETEQTLDSMWTDLGDALAKERRRLEDGKRELLAGRKKLEAEKETMMKSGATDGDVLELNVGGEMFMVQRRTLLLAPEESHLHAMFSGRWEESLARTKDGAIFVNMSPDVFRVILSRLRGSELQAEAPTWRDLRASDRIYQYELEAVLKFFGLVDPVPPIVMESINGGVDVVNGRVLTKNGSGHSLAISSEAMPVGSVWKIHISSLPSNYWIFSGIIGASAALNENSYRDITSCGWAGANQVYVNGVISDSKDGWLQWETGDVAIFKLESANLRMYHMRLGRKFSLPLSPESLWKVHFNMLGSGHQLEVSTPTDQEIDTLN